MRSQLRQHFLVVGALMQFTGLVLLSRADPVTVAIAVANSTGDAPPGLSMATPSPAAGRSGLPLDRVRSQLQRGQERNHPGIVGAACPSAFPHTDHSLSNAIGDQKGGRASPIASPASGSSWFEDFREAGIARARMPFEPPGERFTQRTREVGEMATDSRPPMPVLDFTQIGPQVGERFPDATLPDQLGNPINLHEHRNGRKALVVFHRSAGW